MSVGLHDRSHIDSVSNYSPLLSAISFGFLGSGSEGSLLVAVAVEGSWFGAPAPAVSSSTSSSSSLSAPLFFLPLFDAAHGKRRTGERR